MGPFETRRAGVVCRCLRPCCAPGTRTDLTRPRSRSIRAVTIAAGGVLPNIHSVLLPKAAAEGKKGKQSGSASQAF